MKTLIEPLLESSGFQGLLAREGPRVARADYPAYPYVVSGLAQAIEATVLVVTSTPEDAERFARGAAAFLGDERVALFPAWDALPVEGISPAAEIAARRARAAYRARRAAGPFILAAPVQAALQRLVPGIGENEPFVIEPGAEFAPDALAESLARLGYERTDLVSHRGEFALRGGIVDVFPGTASRPARAEFDGDLVERLRAFSPSTQTSTGDVGRIEVFPVRELLPDENVASRAETLVPRYKDRFRDPLERLSQGLFFEGMETVAPLLFDVMATLGDVVPEGAWAAVAPLRRTLDRARAVVEEAKAVSEAIGWPGPVPLVSLEEVLDGMPRLDLTEFAEGEDLGITGWGAIAGKPEALSARVGQLGEAGYRIGIGAEGQGSLERVVEVLQRGDGKRWDHVAVSGLTEGFVFSDGRIAVVGEDDLFGRRRTAHRAPRVAGQSAAAFAQELTPGDYAVHRVHGVARYVGMVRRAVAGAERDYLLLEYAGGDRLFVPGDQVDVVARYIGGETPRIHRLGSNDWPKAKARVRRAVRDLAGELVRLYAARMSAPGHGFGPDDVWQRELEDAFPHDETPDQLTVADEVKRDMESSRPMDRLVCGDVGYGKTEIAVRAAFKAVMSGKQVGVLVPTTLLAEQHSVTFSERFAAFPVRVEMLSRFLSNAEQRRILEEVAAGNVDVVIGTHRLLSADVRFKDLGLLVVDEEQRFGVEHKEKLKRLRVNVDVLTMTATPIPRTLEMALAGIRDLSIVDTPPEDRQPVLTYVGPYDEQVGLTAVRRELRRGGQVFWVHNRVRSIERIASRLSDRIPEARIEIAHGQMDERVLEKVMLGFWNEETDVLVCTTIIESGLDVPNANTLVVDDAHRMGLSQLYQLRGRVGRSAERAFAYLFFPEHAALTEETHERLATISRYTALGSGYQIALKDLEIRGAGNLLGAEQTGHIAAVGFDTYARLLAESVAEMKGEPLPEEREVRIDLPVRAFLPSEYLGQERLRLDLYRRIASARSPDELAAVREEMEDRFGAVPIEAETLLEVARLRILCLELGIDEVTTFRGQVRVRPIDVEEGELPARLSYHVPTRTLNLEPEPSSMGPTLPGWVREHVNSLSERSPARSEASL
ncbi:MAG: transcription-repair coupling factor [Actinomycetota bacterium]